MKVELYNQHTKVVDASMEEDAFLLMTLQYVERNDMFRFSKELGKTERVTASPIRYLYNQQDYTFAGGLTSYVRRMALKRGLTFEYCDKRVKPCEPVEPPSALDFIDRAFIKEGVHIAASRTRGIVSLPTGCHAKGQAILMADGTTKVVERVALGDLLMGMTGPRRVLRLCRGRQQMVRVQPRKGDGFVVNLDHVLTLVHTETSELVDVSVREWMQWARYRKHCHKLLRVAVDLPERSLPVEPYFVGLLLGDGCVTQSSLTVVNPEPEVHNYLTALADRWRLVVREDKSGGGCPRLRLVRATRGTPNELRNLVDSIGLLGCSAGTKFVPDTYLRSSREQRLELLAGVIDTDGSLTDNGYDWISKSEQLANDVVYLCRSVGLAAYKKPCAKWSQNDTGGTYYRVSVSGHVDMIPCRVARKKAAPRQQIKDVCRTGFDVELLDEQDYYGFTLDGDGRYLMGDFTVTHNTGKGHLAVGLGVIVPTTWMFLTPNKDTYINLVARFEKHCAEPVGRIGKGKVDVKRITVAMMQTVQRRLEDQDKEVWDAVRNTKAICIDEAHTVAAPGRLRVAMSFQNAYWRIGLSATALERPDGRNLITMGATGDVIYWKTIQDEEVKKALARGKVRMIGCRQHGNAKTYLGAYHELVTGSDFRNLMLTAIARVAAKPALLLVREKKHGENLVKALTRANLRVKYITGDADEEERFATLQTIEDNDVDVVVATIFHMAVDIPNLRAVINGAAGDSPISTVQRAGRGSRGREGKETFEVWDVFDQGTGAAEWLVRHARKRRKVYEDEGYEVEVVKELLPLAF